MPLEALKEDGVGVEEVCYGVNTVARQLIDTPCDLDGDLNRIFEEEHNYLHEHRGQNRHRELVPPFKRHMMQSHDLRSISNSYSEDAGLCDRKVPLLLFD